MSRIVLIELQIAVRIIRGKEGGRSSGGWFLEMDGRKMVSGRPRVVAERAV